MSIAPISLKAENLNKSYNGFVAVDNLNIDIRTGEIFGLLGPNGAGKTTSIKMITGLLKPDSGKVIINGESTENNIGSVEQSHLYGATGLYC
jgi:ABC-2 type transport system ATP-binding protein